MNFDCFPGKPCTVMRGRRKFLSLIEQNGVVSLSEGMFCDRRFLGLIKTTVTLVLFASGIDAAQRSTNVYRSTGTRDSVYTWARKGITGVLGRTDNTTNLIGWPIDGADLVLTENLADAVGYGLDIGKKSSALGGFGRSFG